MKRLIITLTLVALTLFAVSPVLAASHDACSHDATVASLRHCVAHASNMGVITNAGIVQSLLAKLDAAQAAVDRSAPETAVNALQAFVNEVRAQSGKGIDAAHAQHMIQHAQAVIAALS